MHQHVMPVIPYSCFLSVLLCASSAYGECVSCGEPQYPEAESLLTAQGFSAKDYEVLVAWNETAADQTGTLVRGVRIRHISAEAAQDLYFDSEGQLLTEPDLRGLGVQPKNWSPQVVSVDSTPVRASKALSPSPPISIPFVGSLATLTLPAPDLAKARREDAEGLEGLAKGVRRIGLVQTLAPPVRITESAATLGVWRTMPGGQRVWAAVFLAPGALGQRLHLTGALLPAGARVVAYNADNQEESYGVELNAEGEGWTATCFSERMALEVSVPADVSIRLTVDRAVYVYSGPGDWTWEKAAGTCNVDLSCHGDWVDLSHGVAGLGTVGRLGYLWCTGTLLADGDPETNIPYFLTANHCVGDQAAADSLEVYWLYQTSACGGDAPLARTVPRTTGGADFLAGATYASGPDFALMRLRGAVPGGVTFAGWETGGMPNQSEVACIHHPRGDYKRISFGRVDAEADNAFGLPAARFHGVRWSLGVTEPGSSGSPLFNASSRRIIGQLYGGGASCSYPNEPDYFGRFDQAFAVVQPYLGDTVRLIRPNGGEYWMPGTDALIEWYAAQSLKATIRIDLLKEGAHVMTLAEGIDASKSFLWRIPVTPPPGQNYSIMITPSSSGVLSDASDAAFSIGPALSINGIHPGAGSVAGGDEVVVRGAGFEGAGGISVHFGGVPALEIVVIDDSELRCKTPLHAAGSVPVTVANAWGGRAVLDNAFVFAQLSPLPEVNLDVNRDGRIDANDLQLVINAVLGGPRTGCDINSDGRVDSLDIQAAVMTAIALS